MSISTKYRSSAAEIMDDFSVEGNEVSDALDKIAKINQWLGGNRLTLEGVKKLLQKAPKQKAICIVDLGCGNGDMLRRLADFGLESGQDFRLIGIDANTFTIDYAKKCSQHYTDIEYLSEDIFAVDYEHYKIDIVLCTLTLHHFKNEEIMELLEVLKKNVSIGIVINDLQRSRVAYRLFQLICSIFKLNRMSREDGLTSILRGFKRKDLVDFSKKLNLSHYTIEWKWAFRYQWIIDQS